jgi:hypothetical protein
MIFTTEYSEYTESSFANISVSSVFSVVLISVVVLGVCYVAAGQAASRKRMRQWS